jgi:hypothetical protein
VIRPPEVARVTQGPPPNKSAWVRWRLCQCANAIKRHPAAIMLAAAIVVIVLILLS